ncbi:MAG TPA: hypothetical protein VFI31_27865 [Pirellulales bacterium]|nr:hypothetical protein [Pirellulales bacterium]
MDLATLAAAVRSQLSSISSIDVKYRKTVEYRKSLPGMPRSDPNYKQDVQDLEWAEQGDCRLFSTTYAPEMKRDSYSVSFDGATGYNYTWDPGQRVPDRLFIRSETSSGYWSADPPFFIGKQVVKNGPGLVDLLSAADTELVGDEMFGGHKCWRVFRREFARPSGPFQFSALLDEGHDFLPAQLDVRHAESRLHEHLDDAYWKDVHTTWTVEEFMRVTDLATRSERWFPKKVTLEHFLDKHVFTVTSVTLNGNIPIERFRPHAPDGAIVHDVTTPDVPKSYIVGGNPASDALVERAAREAISELRSRETPAAQTLGIDARPGRRHWVAIALFGCSLLVCSVAVFFWYRVIRA